MNLIKKLRRQFILLATLAIFIIVAGALGLINMMGFYAMREHCLDTMTYITQNGGTMPSRYHPADTASWGKTSSPASPGRKIHRNLPTRPATFPFALTAAAASPQST